MEKNIEKIICKQKDKQFLAYFQYSHPVIVLHLSYMAEVTDEKYALERFLVRILDNLSTKNKRLPVATIAHLCGVDISIINQTLRDMTDKALINAIQPGIYKVFESTKEKYFDNVRPREPFDRDFVIDSITRESLPLPVYEATHGSPQVYKLVSDLDAVGMTADERNKYEYKLEKASEKRKVSLGFPTDADKFCVRNTTAAQLPGFYVIYFATDGKLTKQLYFGDKLIDTSFADIGALQFGLDCKDGRFIKKRNMPDGHLYAIEKKEFNDIIVHEFNLDPICEFEVDNNYECGVQLNILDKYIDREVIFKCLDIGYMDVPIYDGDFKKCGEIRVYFRCADSEIRTLLQFYSSTRKCRNKESVVKIAENLHLPWRKALLKTGRLGLLEDIDINDYII